ncbi:hypothetical protein ACWD0J_24980 [Streptomyces sp. NPDC003011]
MTAGREGEAVADSALHIAEAVSATVIGLEDAPRGYAEFDRGASREPRVRIRPARGAGRVRPV